MGCREKHLEKSDVLPHHGRRTVWDPTGRSSIKGPTTSRSPTTCRNKVMDL